MKQQNLATYRLAETLCVRTAAKYYIEAGRCCASLNKSIIFPALHFFEKKTDLVNFFDILIIILVYYSRFK